LMTEVKQEPTAARPSTAGGLLKQARQAKGLHIAALAASIKVAQRKLELLEADRFTELPDATFTRALAQTVCRSLKIDAAPVLALLPPASGGRLDQMGEGINAPFRDRPGRGEPTDWGRVVASPAVWGPSLVLLAALTVYLLPSSFLNGLQLSQKSVALPAAKVAAPAAAVAAPASPASAMTPTPGVAAEAVAASSVAATASASAPSLAPGAVETVFSAPPFAESASAAKASATAGGLLASTNVAGAASGAALQLRATTESWVEVQDAKSQMLLSRMLQAGETVRLDGALPMRLKVGNAAGTEVMFRGQAVNLLPSTVGNIARLELK
jgi:cytoskeleton protein RodZ